LTLPPLLFCSEEAGYMIIIQWIRPSNERCAIPATITLKDLMCWRNEKQHVAELGLCCLQVVV